MLYTLKVRSGLPFTYHAKKSRFYNLDGSDTTLTDTTISDPMIAYQGLAASFDELENLDTISFTGGELPDYSIANGIVKIYAPSGYTYWNYNTNTYGNFSIIGDVKINTFNGESTNYSTTNYLQLPTPFNPGNDTWEAIIKIKTSSDTSTTQYIFNCCKGVGQGGRYGVTFGITGSKFAYFASSSGSSWLFDLTGSYTVLANTTYWVKFGWDGTDWYLEYSIDGITYTRDITYTSSSVLYSPIAYTYIGIYSTSSISNPFLGVVYLQDCEVNINGTTWWTPAGGKLYEKFGDGCMDSEWVDDGSSAYYNVFYNSDDGFYLSNQNYIHGSMWTGELNIPSHTVPSYLTQQWTTYGSLVINQQMKNTTNFNNKYVELDIGSLPENFELIVKNTFNYNNSTGWIFTNSGTQRTCDPHLAAMNGNYMGTWYSGGFRYRSTALTSGKNYWYRVRKVNGVKYLYYLLDDNNTYTLDTLPSITNWSNALIVNDTYVYPDDPKDTIRLGNHQNNVQITSQYSYNTFFFDTFQVNELDLHNIKKRQVLTMFDNTPHAWINDDGEQFILNRNQNGTGDEGCLTNGKGFTGFTNTTNTCIISNYTFSYSSGSGSVTPFEIVAHIKTGSSTTGTNRCIYSSGTNYPGGMYLVILSNGTVEGCIHNNENNFKAITTTALQPNTEYWIKVTNATGFFPTPQYSIYLSTDGVNYTLEGTMPGTIPTQWTTTGNRTLVVGSQNGGSCFGDGGVVYPDGSYIKINGSTVWQLGINI